MFQNVYTRILLVDRQGGIWIHTLSGLYRIWFTRSPLQPVMMGHEAEEEERGLSMLSISKGSQRRLPVESERNCTLLPVPQNEAMCLRCSW